MSRSVKDLRELICVSRLTVRESDDDSEVFSDEEQQIIRAFSRLSSYQGDYRPESVIYTIPTSLDSKSPDSGIGTNGQSPEVDAAGAASGDAEILSPHPPSGGKRSGASRRKRKQRKEQKLLDTLPTMHELPKVAPLPPVATNPFKPTERPRDLDSSSEDDESRPMSSSSQSSGGKGASISVLESRLGPPPPPRTNFDELLTYMDATMIAEWLNQCNEQVAELSQWIHQSDNFIQFAHFWLSDFPDMQRQEIFHLEYSILIDHLNLVFAAGRDAGKVQYRLLVQFLEAVFWEFPGKLLSSKGPHLYLNYLDVLTSERQTQYKVLLSDVKCSTRIKQYAQWTLAVRAFTLVNVWMAIVNFYRRLLTDCSKGPPVLLSTIGKYDPSMDRMYHAIRAGHVDVVHYFLASGKVNARAVDSHGRTLIFTAVMHSQPDILNFLLRKVTPRPDINLAADTGNSPLHAAANNGDVAIVTTLLRAKDIEVNTTNALCENATPLHLAVMHGHQHVVEVLLVAGADRNAKMGDLSATDIARDFGHDEIYKVLLQKDLNHLIP